MDQVDESSLAYIVSKLLDDRIRLTDVALRAVVEGGLTHVSQREVNGYLLADVEMTVGIVRRLAAEIDCLHERIIALEAARGL